MTMFRAVTVLACVVALTSAAPNPVNIFKIDLSPEEAQQYLNSPPFTEPKLAGRTNVLPLVRWNDPKFRTAEAGPTLGHYWKNGKEIENTQDYVEEVYDASQFHGQDGLGAYVYGYETPESAKVENRVRSGDVTGSYAYQSGNDLIKVRYWADSQGFHQEDNIPKVELQPAQEAEDVRQARLAHEKAWQEAAKAAAQNPDPQGEYHADRYDYQPAASEQQRSVAAPPQFAPAPAAPAAPQREGKAYYNAQAQASYQTNQPSYQTQQPNYPAKYGNLQSTTEPEPTGPPRGFFYSYKYPVSILVNKNEQQGNPGQPIDHDSVGINTQRYQK